MHDDEEMSFEHLSCWDRYAGSGFEEEIRRTTGTCGELFVHVGRGSERAYGQTWGELLLKNNEAGISWDAYKGMNQGVG